MKFPLFYQFQLLIKSVTWSTVTSGTSTYSHPVTATNTITVTSVVTCTKGCTQPTTAPSETAPSVTETGTPPPVIVTTTYTTTTCPGK